MDTKDQIVSTSLRLFNQRGEESAGVREIARELGISPGNLSYHFARKEDIIQHHLNQLNHEWEVLISVYLEEEEDLHRFTELIRNCLERQFEYRGLFHQGTAAKPEVLLKRIDESLVMMGRLGQIQVGEEDLQFLKELIGFQVQFWLCGLDLEESGNSRDDLVKRHLLVIVKLLMLFASPNGRINLLRFKAALIR